MTQTATFLFQVDGEEDIKAGLDLHEMAEVLLQMGIWQAAVSLVASRSAIAAISNVPLHGDQCVHVV